MKELLPYPFLIEIRKVELKTIGIRPFLFKVYYNGFSDDGQYNKNLEFNLHKFYQRITYLPQKFRDKENRACHLIYLRELLHFIQINVTEKQNGLFIKKKTVCKKFANQYYRLSIFDIAKKENSKLLRMLNIQKKYLINAIKIIEGIAEKERIKLLKEHSHEQFYHFKTNQTNEVLSLAFKIFFDVITEENYNKKELSKFLSNSFETKKTKSPSETKLYHYFTQYSPETVEKVKKLMFETMVKIKNM